MPTHRISLNKSDEEEFDEKDYEEEARQMDGEARRSEATEVLEKHSFMMHADSGAALYSCKRNLESIPRIFFKGE